MTLPPDWEGKLKYIVESNGLVYGVFWQDKAGVCTWSAHYVQSTRLEALAAAKLPNYALQIKKFSFPMGFGVPGRVLFHHNYEWHSNVQAESLDDFPLRKEAIHAAIKTVVCVAVPGGVVEIGHTLKMPEDPKLVDTIQATFNLDND
mmetsp:Transcript_22266/g.69299  ORF Transcript_22266/g.69299 Transcript_22266/m.69299 type:complete len:147 (-) Transcript_22266:366-806(-)|eukprot:CAMPEP_0182864906 /NCGR_PEP_ID=MMETSP0034_2-20130328/7412_1 /TAXON_ID=156128 /ORGANISM="Nephroselmis pyriformis, Strain CCMP717" /LENGTH=146 /DNA_ID=CAMNT_0024997179 /DNA_START=128 /DNA_END=568 /DNA_ORIENTATION=+